MTNKRVLELEQFADMTNNFAESTHKTLVEVLNSLDLLGKEIIAIRLELRKLAPSVETEVAEEILRE